MFFSIFQVGCFYDENVYVLLAYSCDMEKLETSLEDLGLAVAESDALIDKLYAVSVYGSDAWAKQSKMLMAQKNIKCETRAVKVTRSIKDIVATVSSEKIVNIRGEMIKLLLKIKQLVSEEESLQNICLKEICVAIEDFLKESAIGNEKREFATLKAQISASIYQNFATNV